MAKRPKSDFAFLPYIRGAPKKKDAPPASTISKPRIYWEPDDYAGIGRPHRMVAWKDDAGVPRSIIISPEGKPEE